MYQVSNDAFCLKHLQHYCAPLLCADYKGNYYFASGSLHIFELLDVMAGYYQSRHLPCVAIQCRRNYRRGLKNMGKEFVGSARE